MATVSATPRKVEEDSSSDSSASPSPTPLASRESSSENLLKETTTTTTAAAKKQPKSLADRKKIPSSLYLSLFVILVGQYCGGLWTIETPQLWLRSMKASAKTCFQGLEYLRDFMTAAANGEITDPAQIAKVSLITFALSALFYVLIVAPLMAGMWTGQRARRHRIHRYMGLSYLIQYTFVWVEFLTNYNQDGFLTSILPHTIALNGMIQGYSAFFSFSVLPDLEDPGYYSDKAVVSRNFIHENIFFTLYSVFGSFYYNHSVRENWKHSFGGQLIELAFIFWPYVAVRLFFPMTRFSNAGNTKKGRSERNERFYEIGTLTVKIFFLWAKYFLGFFVNNLAFLGLYTPAQWKFVHGMFLLNLGTVSISIFLHTLRFKKVLPAKLTFSLYLMQIYATFSAIPLAYDLFLSHQKLCALSAMGLLINLTRNRTYHGIWCLMMMYFLIYRKDIEW